MTTQITIDKAGRVLIPKALREELRLRPGDVLELESQGDDITLRPRQAQATLVKEHGIWVASTGPAEIDLVEFIREQREARSRHVAGLDPE
jgi:AbrB family transcriptional regulator (stage V sporulation protein T)